jgi:MFS family permease
MSAHRNPTTGAAVVGGALLASLALAVLDMTTDNLALVVVLLFGAGFLVGWMAPTWALLAGLCIGIMLPIAKVYVTSFDLRLPHPMHGYYLGALAVAPPMLSALVAKWLREEFDHMRHRRRNAARAAAR